MSNNKIIDGTGKTQAGAVEHFGFSDAGAHSAASNPVTGVMELASYPTLVKHSKDSAHLSHWLGVLADGVAAGQIRNVNYNDAKQVVSRAVGDAWSAIRGVYFYNGRWQSLPSEVQELDHTLNVYGLHDVLAAHKRLVRSDAQHEAVEAMRSFATEVLPLALAVADLKSKIVKGRAPSAGPSKPENPNKLVKTCPCCFRQIAVVRDKMALHGYERPGQGWQTASCPGIRFKPLEVSTEGLVWLISTFEERLAVNQAAWKRRDQLDSILTQRRNRAGDRELVKVTRDMPEWAMEFRVWCAQTESEIRSLQSDLKRCNKRLAEWKPEKAE